MSDEQEFAAKVGTDHEEWKCPGATCPYIRPHTDEAYADLIEIDEDDGTVVMGYVRKCRKCDKGYISPAGNPPSGKPIVNFEIRPYARSS